MDFFSCSFKNIYLFFWLYNNKSIFANDQTSKNSINKRERKMQESFEEAPLWAAVITYMGYLILNIYGWLRDFLRFTGIEKKKTAMDNNPSVS